MKEKYKKFSFLYFVESFFQLKYLHLLLISIIFSLAISFITHFLIYIKNVDSNNLLLITLTFAILFIFSQIILISTRYGQEIMNTFIGIFTNLFGKEIIPSFFVSKSFYFILALLLHIGLCGLLLF